MPGEHAYLKSAIARYPPEVTSTARAAIKKLRALFPGARMLVYERRQNTPIGFAPAAGGGALFSIVIYQRWVRLIFLEGAALDDPQKRLEGSGNQVRSIKLDPHAALLDEPYTRRLIAASVKDSGLDLVSGRPRIELKSTVEF